jgi:carbamate kinase
MTQDAQAKNIRSAAKAIAKVVTARDNNWNVVLTHGNGPQVGFLSLQQSESFSLELLTAQTQGLIGAQVRSHAFFLSHLFLVFISHRV